MNSIRVANWAFQPNLPGRPSAQDVQLAAHVGRLGRLRRQDVRRLDEVDERRPAQGHRAALRRHVRQRRDAGRQAAEEAQAGDRMGTRHGPAVAAQVVEHAVVDPPDAGHERVGRRAHAALDGGVVAVAARATVEERPQAFQRRELGGEHVGAHRRRAWWRPAWSAWTTIVGVTNPAPKAGISRTTPCPPAITAVTQIVCAFSETAMPLTRNGRQRRPGCAGRPGPALPD